VTSLRTGFLNACANVHCVNACVCFEDTKYSSSSSSSVHLSQELSGKLLGWPTFSVHNIVEIVQDKRNRFNKDKSMPRCRLIFSVH